MLDPSNYHFSVYSIPTLVAMAAILLLGVFVLMRERISTVSTAFLLVSLTVSIWLFCFSMVYSAANESVALWWAKAAYLGVPFIAPATYQFTVVVLRIFERYKPVALAGWALSGLFAIAAIATDWLVSGMERYWWGFYTSYGWLGAPFILFFISLLLASMRHYLSQYRAAPEGRRKKRIQWLMLAFSIGYIGVVDFVATYGIPLYPFGYLPILGFVVVAARAIWVYRLVDITPAFAAREIIDTMTDALLVLDRDGVIQLANREAYELFGYEKAHLLGRTVDQVLEGVHLNGRFQALLALGRVRDYEVAYRARDGSLRILSISASVMVDRLGEPVATVCVVRDITEHKRATEEIMRLTETLEQRVEERTAQLQAANEELEKEIAERRRAEQDVARLLVLEQQARTHAEELARAREVMLSVVSHDLRNPLSVIKATVPMLRRLGTPSNKEEADRLQAGLMRIDVAAGKMDRLINELLDFAQLQAGQPLELHRQRTDLVALARRIVEYHSQTIAAGRSSLHIRLECSVPELFGLWDPIRLERVLDNLLSNAIKYSPGGGEIVVGIGLEANCDVHEEPDDRHGGQSGGACAVIVVRDQGIGIPDADMPYIFDWFRRANNVPGRIGGTGIGLASVLQAVEEHGGSISVSSREGVGTAFTVKLPLAQHVGAGHDAGGPSTQASIARQSMIAANTEHEVE